MASKGEPSQRNNESLEPVQDARARSQLKASVKASLDILMVKDKDIR
jgi:hypothetical protein